MNTSEKIEALIAAWSGFMSPVIHKDRNVLLVETNGGTCVVPCDALGLADPPPSDCEEGEAARWTAEVGTYCEHGITDPDSCFETVSGFVCRLSASGYMDCTEWEYCETEADVLAWLESEAEGAGVDIPYVDDHTVANRRTWIASNDHVARPVRFRGWTCDSATHYGAWENATPAEATHVRVEYATGSDYVGGRHTLANFRAFEEMESEHGDAIVCIHGGHGTYGIILAVDVAADVWEMVEGLADYPCVSDEAVSEVEEEWRQEAMVDAIGEATQVIIAKLCPYIDDNETTMAIVEKDNRLHAIVEEAAQAFDGWEYEHASAYADADKVAADAMESEAWKLLHAEVFEALMSGTGSTLVRVTTEAGACVEEYKPTDDAMPHDDIVAMVKREYGGTADIVIEIFMPNIHPLDVKE